MTASDQQRMPRLDDTRIMNPDSEYRRIDMEVFHPGQRPGELAASPLNPLLYP